ncbi:hypothetical protein AAFF_G00214420 [Aldrovandia affinis]|uniref:Ig-like domain-containing protein n=1 Tax=Aldrovandia affinis TaxID=143900 RepID=A0AAD7RH89_9TELE|nr:hypothetical protein AAFF_G00214420 [Aldrovandia affinis]
MLFCCLFILLTGCESLSVNQQPAALLVKEGSPVKIDCEVTGTSSPSISWFRQMGSDPMEMLFFSGSLGSVEPASVGAFSPSRDSWPQFPLETTAASANDSALYYCAGSFTVTKTRRALIQKPRQQR